MPEQKYYLKIGQAADLKDKRERIIYRFLEIGPGALSWLTFFLIVFLSWARPAWAAVFIILFVFYWLLKTIYLSFHLWSGYKKMRAQEKIDWLPKLEKDFPQAWEKIHHLIIIPFYREPLEIIREAFRSLEQSDYQKDKMIVVLAAEKRAGKGARLAAKAIAEEFGGKFLKLLVTWHPSGLPGEIAGKGSNESWAAKKVKEQIIDSLGLSYENIIVSSFDADTAVFPQYFSCLTYNYLSSKDPTNASFQPVPLFINNIWQAPFFSRIFAFSSTFWQIMTQERPEKLITFSSHSMSFKTLVAVGFRQTNVVSDDSRIFWQCFLQYDGNYRTRPLYYPVSMDANVAESFWQTLVNIYRQQRRWAYGAADIPYFLFGFWKNKKIPKRKKFSLGFELIEGHWSWATASFLLFLLGWLPLILGGSQFSQNILSYNLPRITSWILTVGMIGLVASAYFSLLLLPAKPRRYGKLKYLFFVFGWFLVPLTMIFLTALPALDAQTRLMLGHYMGFWPTEKVRKR